MKMSKEIEYNLGNSRNIDDDFKSVDWFTEKMKMKLFLNKNKPHWDKVSIEYLITRLQEELEELKTAVLGDELVMECADVANFAMMIADKSERSFLGINNNKQQ